MKTGVWREDGDPQVVPLVREIDTALPSRYPGQGVCFQAGLRRGAQTEGSAGIRDICWEHVGRGWNRENESKWVEKR